MNRSPAVFFSSTLLPLLEKHSICKVAYEELTETQFPWEMDRLRLHSTRKKMARIDLNLRAAHTAADITCLLAGEGAYWLDAQGFPPIHTSLQETLDGKRPNASLPIWKMTTAEMYSSHIDNLRRLVLTTSYDGVILEQLKRELGDHHTFFMQEFEHYDRYVRVLLDDMKDQGPNLQFAQSDTIILIERAHITQHILDNHIMTPQQLGYSRQDLLRVIQILEKRCSAETPTFRKRLETISSQMISALRDSEATQLSRASRWEFTFSLLKPAPLGYRGLAKLSTIEREFFQFLVTSREEELGASEQGTAVLQAASDVNSGAILTSQFKKTANARPESQPQPQKTTQPSTDAKRRLPSQGMAYLNRKNTIK
ncbi:MAG: hypothetical protein RBU29_16750 [bacterium]|jgi:hypothetical protein|nr:hypothetical protein [bacterium]